MFRNSLLSFVRPSERSSPAEGGEGALLSHPDPAAADHGGAGVEGRNERGARERQNLKRVLRGKLEEGTI